MVRVRAVHDGALGGKLCLEQSAVIDSRRGDESQLVNRGVLQLTVTGVDVIAAVVVGGGHERRLGVDVVITIGSSEHDPGHFVGERPVVLTLEMEDGRGFLERGAGAERPLRLQRVATAVR